MSGPMQQVSPLLSMHHLLSPNFNYNTDDHYHHQSRLIYGVDISLAAIIPLAMQDTPQHIQSSTQAGE